MSEKDINRKNLIQENNTDNDAGYRTPYEEVCSHEFADGCIPADEPADK